jgi:hypothetical protein
MVRLAAAAGIFVLIAHGDGLGAQTTGVAACDDFLKKYEACIVSQAPAAAQSTFKEGIEKMRKSFLEAAKQPGGKAALEGVCKQGAEHAKVSLSIAGLVCTF